MFVLLKKFKERGKKHISTIVVALLSIVTTGLFCYMSLTSDKRNKELMEIVEDRDVYWVSAVGADDPQFNDRFAEFAKDYKNIHIVEWDKAAKGHPEYLYADGVHPKGQGNKVYAQLIYDAIYNNLSKKN